MSSSMAWHGLFLTTPPSCQASSCVVVQLHSQHSVTVTVNSYSQHSFVHIQVTALMILWPYAMALLFMVHSLPRR